ncbi:MAG: hypothetical protein OXC02_07580 [Rhodobacteraceae bacterium]|nr:hypothetical protein [Paracoccaceae bacterium]
MTNWMVSAAHVHDSLVFEVLLEDFKPDCSRQVRAEDAYRSDERVAGLCQKGLKPWINYQGQRDTPLRSLQLALNHAYSRAKV